MSARKWTPTDTYSLVGTKLGIMLLNSKVNFLRSIFMSGTLFVNSVYDIEPIISLGYKKAPMNNFNMGQLENINNNVDEMKIYYNGLISYYQKPSDARNFPSTKYHMVKIEIDDDIETDLKDYEKDPFYVHTRNELNIEKINWIMSFIKKHKNERTLIYAQFLNKAINTLAQFLEAKKYKFGIISGQLTAQEKQSVQNDYNSGKINILLFTLAIKEGISFKESDNFIYVQPYWNYAITEQIMARGLRADSHKEGIKSVVNIYMLCSIYEDSSSLEDYFKYVENIFNNNIKNYIPELIESKIVEVKSRAGNSQKRVDITKFSKLLQDIKITTDIKLYSLMIEKQGNINIFEKVLLNIVPSFEKSNNIESNEFIETYNEAIIKYEKEENKIMKLKDKLELKKRLYMEYYNKQILKTNSKILRIENDTSLRQVRNPTLDETLNNPSYPDSNISNIKKLLDGGYSLVDVLQTFKLSKTEITTFQANFTPDKEVEIIITESGIKDDKREKLMILEPTSGIGNVISHILKCPNVQNFMIDSVEIHKLFYQIQKARFNDIGNINMYNIDLLKYHQKYTYDYILGNPPFNIRTTTLKKGVLVNLQLYDVDFVAMCYNMLSKDGKLTMIISNRYLRNFTLPVFASFISHLKILTNAEKNNVIIKEIGNFKQDKTSLKEMETNYGMVCITLKKIGNLLFDLSTVRATDMKENLQMKAEKMLNKENILQKKEDNKIIREEKKLLKEKIVKVNVEKLKKQIDKQERQTRNDEKIRLKELKKLKKNKRLEKLKSSIEIIKEKQKEDMDIIQKAKDELEKKREEKKQKLLKQKEPPLIYKKKRGVLMNENVNSEYEEASSKLLKLLFKLDIKDIKEVLVEMKFKGRINTNKMLLGDQLLQNFNTITKINPLIEKLERIYVPRRMNVNF